MLLGLSAGLELLYATLAETRAHSMTAAAITFTAPIRILRLPEVCKTTGLGRAMIYRLQAARRFPKSVKITEHAVGWIETEVQAWLAERIATRQEV